MNLRIALAATAAAFAFGAAAAPAACAELYFGVRMVDPVVRKVSAPGWLLVDKGRIVRTGVGAPPASIRAERRDFTGRFAMPGLIDSHAHLTLGPVAVEMRDGKPAMKSAPDPAITRQSALMLLAHGVTTIRDPGGATRDTVAYARGVRSGAIQGPEALVAGEVIDRTPMPFEGLADRPTPQRGVAAIVAEQANKGVDYIKLYTLLTPQDLAEGVAEARKHGKRTVAHLDDVSWTRGAELGIDAIVHMMPTSADLLPPDRREAYLKSRRPGGFSFFEWWEQVDLDRPEIREMVQTLARRKTHVEGTLIAFHRAYWGDDPAVRDADLALSHPALVENWKSMFRFDIGWTADDYRRARAVWPKVLRLTRMLHEAGVPMTLGTDANNPFVAPGASLHREMRLHADAGISNWDVLAMATSEPARIMGLGERTGRLKAGLDADVVFLEADPSADVANISRVAAVLHNGRLLDPAVLKAEAGR